MSALELLREVMSAPHDPVQYDTDTVSVTSTVEDEEVEVWYSIECIIAERDTGHECYLVKWEDYPLDQCTWEPPENLESTDIITKWKQVKEALGKAAFRRDNEKNITAYHDAQRAAELAKARKYNKREKKRKKLQRRTRRVVYDDDSSEEEPLTTVQRDGDLFIEEQRRTASGSPVKSTAKTRPPPVPRKAPLQHSSSEEESSSEAHDSDVPLFIELQRKKEVLEKAERKKAGAGLHSSVLQKEKNITKDTPTKVSSGEPAVHEIGRQRVKGSAVTTKPTLPTASGQDRTVMTTTTAQKPTNSAEPGPGGGAARTDLAKQTKRAISFVDGLGKTRKEGSNTDTHFKKVRSRYLAEKRGRTEAMPDFGKLNFVNGPPPSLPQAIRRPSSDPYARRDITNRRVQEEDPDDQPRLRQAIGPLADFEKNKVPMMCNAWKLSSNCTYGAHQCPFLHRTHDPEGRPYQLGDIHNRVPQKYRKPPITCEFWYDGNRCKKSAEECTYAHEDTGWTEVNGRPIEREHVPPKRTGPMPQNALSHLAPKLQNPPITCHYWLRDPQRCNKAEADCKYAHWNTGWAPRESDIKGVVPIDPDLRPRGVVPKHANPPVTCPFWLRGDNGCTRSDEECKYAHFNTGWIPRIENGTGNLSPVQIDRNEEPRNGPVRSRIDISAPKNRNPPITCLFWLDGPSGCTYNAVDCKFAHRNTGWITHYGQEHTSDPEPVDPVRKPRFWRFDPTEEGSAQDSTAQKSHVATASGKASLDFTSQPSFDIADYFLDECFRELVQSPTMTQNELSAQAQNAINTSKLSAKIEKHYNLNFDEMFRSIIPGDSQPLERRAMLLYSPEDHSEDIDLITRWLLMHDVQVSNLWYDGAWTQFQQDASEGKSGIIIAHPDFERWVELPGLGDVLKQRIRVWSVGLQPPPEYEFGVSPNPPDLCYDRIDIFPHGGFIYITGDVFDQKPQLALSIVKQFFAKVEQLRSLNGPASPWLEVNDACLLWRLCVRPELMESLYQECEQNAAELAAQNPDYLSRAELYQLLTSTNYVEQDHSIEPVSLIQDKYPILSERRVIAEHPPLEYFNRVDKSQEDATTHTIGYYAAMQSADLRRAYRHFYIVHTEPEAECAKKWKASIHSIAEIITPEQCIEELSKPSKKSLFDFLDWAMEPKEKPSAEELEKEMGDAPMEMSSLAK